MTNQQAKNLGAYIHALRNQRGLSTRAVARAAGVHGSQITRLEQGVVKAPQATVLVEIAATLHTTLDDLLAHAGIPSSQSLPDIHSYLRTKFTHLPGAVIDDLAISVLEAAQAFPITT